MTEEEKKIKKLKIEENRQKRHRDSQSPMIPTSIGSPLSDDTGKLSPPSPSHHQLKVDVHLLSSVDAYTPTTLSGGQDDLDKGVAARGYEESVDVNVLTPLSEDRSPVNYDRSGLTSPMDHLGRDGFTSSGSVHGSLPESPQSESVCSPGSSVGIDVKPPANLLSLSPSTSGTSPSSQCCGCYRSSGSPGSHHLQNTVNGVLNMAIKSEFSSPLHVVTPELETPPTLTDEEIAKLNELNIANKALKSPLTDDTAIQSNPSLINVINLTDIAIRRLIKMSKKITGFKNLCESDQIALLKGGCTELMILRSVMTYNPENDCWQGPEGPKVMQIKLDVLRTAKGNVYEEHKRFIHSFDYNWRADENIMLILGAITLFSPTRPHVVHRDIIRMEQDSYYSLLRRYLDSIYSACEAQAAFKKLVQRIEELHILNENHVRVFLDVDPKDVEPLLIEIFDLKHH